MRRDDVDRALDVLASQVEPPRADASAVVERGRRRTRQRRITLVGVVAVLGAVVAAVGAFAHDDNSKPPTVRDAEHETRSVVGGPSTDIAAPTADEAWKCRNPIEYTADGGTTWRATKLPGISREGVLCAAIAGGTGWAVASDDAGHQRIFRIRAGGAHIDTFALPRAMAGGLTAPIFIDEDHGWIAALYPRASGDRVVYRTIDGGATWTRVAHRRLQALSFASPTVGWSSDGSNVLRTADGGHTWHAAHHVAEQLFQVVATPNGAVAWGGRLVTRTQYHDFLDVTTDDGKTWTRRPGPRDFELPNGWNLFNATDGSHWQQSSGNALRVSSDAGRTWETRPDMPGGRNGPLTVRFSTAEVFWFTSDQGEVFRTTDGGRSWNNVTRGGEHPVAAPAQPVPIPLAFVSPTEGWLCSGPTMLYTTDAGANWKNVTVPSHPPTRPRNQLPVCAATPGGDVWMITTTADADGLQVIHVSAGGRHVETSAFPPLRTDWTVQNVAFADRDHGWAYASDAAGGASAMFATADGGRTWQDDQPVRGVTLFASAREGWAALDLFPSELAHTTDGGRTWERVQAASESDGALRPVGATGHTVVALAVTNGSPLTRPAFAVTTDGGSYWARLPVPRAVNLGATEPYAAGATDAVHWQFAAQNWLWTTADGGRSWAQVAEFAGLSKITAVHFLTPAVGFVAGSGLGAPYAGTVVLRTTDAGATWTTVDGQAPPRRSGRVAPAPGGIVGCPTRHVTPAPPGNPPAGLVAAAIENVRSERHYLPTVDRAYPLAAPPADAEFASVFSYNVGACDPGVVVTSWVVEMHGPIGQGAGGSTAQAQVVLAHYADGWHVFGRYH